MAENRIAASYVYTLDAEEPIVNGYVEYDDDGTVTAVGRCEDISSEKRFLDGAIVPGFVNAHCHVELSHLHGKFRKGTGMAGFIDQINELRDWAGREVKVELVRKWMDKMWSDGVSAMADISNDDSSFEVKASHPMYTRTFLEVFGSEPHMCEGVMNEVTELNAAADAAGIDAAPTPHSCYTMSPQLLSASAAAGLERGYLSYHSQESLEEEELIRYGSGAMYENRKRSGMSTPPVTGESSLKYFMDRLADARPAPYDAHVLLVHNVCLSQDDIDAARKVMNNVYWAICPLSNQFIHDALPPVRLMRENGLDVMIGTDSLSSNDDLDMVKEMYCLHENFPEVGMNELLSWASLNGARFLSKEDELGSLIPGKKPGLVFIGNLDGEGCLTAESRSERII
ncbi:MAG: amidohydrolase family protein [Bacteroidales bacterium]|nr:amidohydrolase family protein [Bacteroidales bacterium]MBQ9722034.1 amidohydrolase family protein [Bacteroidales bacterium]